MRLLLTYAVLALAFTACDRGAARPNADAAATLPVIAVISPSEGHPQWPGIRGGAQHCAAAYPSVQVYTMVARQNTSDSLLAATELALSVGARAICFLVEDPAAMRAALDRAAAQQVLMLTIGAPCPDGRITRHIDVDWAGGAELLGASLERIAAGRSTYLLLHYRERSGLDARIHDRFVQAAERQYGVQLLQARALAPRDSAPDAVLEQLALFRHAALLVTLDPQVWLAPRAGWHRALRQENANFRFATLAAAPVLWKHLGTPETPGEAAALVGPLDGALGFAAVRTAVQLLLDPTQVPTRVVLPCELVTPETLPDFAQRYAAAAGGLDVQPYLPAGRTPSTQPAATTRVGP